MALAPGSQPGTPNPGLCGWRARAILRTCGSRAVSPSRKASCTILMNERGEGDASDSSAFLQRYVQHPQQQDKKMIMVTLTQDQIHTEGTPAPRLRYPGSDVSGLSCLCFPIQISHRSSNQFKQPNAGSHVWHFGGSDVQRMLEFYENGIVVVKISSPIDLIVRKFSSIDLKRATIRSELPHCDIRCFCERHVALIPARLISTKVPDATINHATRSIHYPTDRGAIVFPIDITGSWVGVAAVIAVVDIGPCAALAIAFA